VRSTALMWFKSYLTNHTQFVTYNGVSSSSKAVKCCVPQGSILGPLLFLLYINDLHTVCKHTLSIRFADDTNLFMSGRNINEMLESINEELQHIYIWLKVNKLSLNIKKTQFMIFSKKRSKSDRPEISLNIDGKPISETNQTKFLGVIIDNKLSWKEHVRHISGKVSKGIGIIIKLRPYLSQKAIKSMYYSFVYPYFTYCNHIWGCSSKTTIRILCHAKYKAPLILFLSS